jgi:hypothetical protein
MIAQAALLTALLAVAGGATSCPTQMDGTTGTGSGTSTRHAKQSASPDWGAVTDHMVHTTPGADLPIPWTDGPRHTATCSNGSHAEWVGPETAAELCAPYHVLEQH